MKAKHFSKVRPLSWQCQRRSLLRLRRHLIAAHLGEIRASFAGGSAASRPSTPDAPADFTLALLAHEPDGWREINDALDRIDGGTYGRCAATGARIPVRRLRAMPWLRHAIESPVQPAALSFVHATSAASHS